MLALAFCLFDRVRRVTVGIVYDLPIRRAFTLYELDGYFFSGLKHTAQCGQ